MAAKTKKTTAKKAPQPPPEAVTEPVEDVQSVRRRARRSVINDQRPAD